MPPSGYICSLRFRRGLTSPAKPFDTHSHGKAVKDPPGASDHVAALFHSGRLIVENRSQLASRHGYFFGPDNTGTIAHLHAVSAGRQGKAGVQRLLAATTVAA